MGHRYIGALTHYWWLQATGAIHSDQAYIGGCKLLELYTMIRPMLRVVRVVAAAGAVGTVAAAVDASSQICSEGHTWGTAANQYILHRAMGAIGMVAKWKLDNDTCKALDLQRQFIEELIKENAQTEYGQRFGFGSRICTAEDFQREHPLTTFPHYADYMQRAADGGELTLLTKQPISRIGVTSGTSGRPANLPVVPEQRKIFFLQGITVVFDRVASLFPDFQHSMQRTLKLFFSPTPRSTPGGLPIGPNSSAPKDSQKLLQLYTTPSAAYDVLSEPEALYLYALFAMKDRNLGCIESNFVSAVYHFFNGTVHQKFDRLVRDIREGSIDATLDIPLAVRNSLQAELLPDPERADELSVAAAEAGLRSSATSHLAHLIWPHLHFVLAVSTGTFELYGQKLREEYTGSIPIYSPLYAATEGLLGVNIDGPGSNQCYRLIPRAMYYEFIPVAESEEQQPLTVGFGGLEAGKQYEMVVSTKCGLYRYRLGDVVRVKRFDGQTPVVEVCYRRGQLLNVRGEKMPEDVLFKALSQATGGLGSTHSLVDYTVISSLQDPKCDAAAVPSYIVYVELEGSDAVAPGQLSSLLDEQLCALHPVYASYRAKNSISAPRVRAVSAGGFEAMRNALVARGMSPNQLKMPRVLKDTEMIQILQDVST